MEEMEEILVLMVVVDKVVRAMRVKAVAAVAAPVENGYAQEETKFRLVDGKEQNKVLLPLAV